MHAQRRLLIRAGIATGLTALAGGVAVKAQTTPRVIAIAARRFTYDPDEVTVRVNEPVVFRLTTLDVVMGFSVPEFGVRATIVPGQSTDLPLTPTKPGDFTFLCDVFCGSGHENMDGILHVVA